MILSALILSVAIAAQPAAFNVPNPENHARVLEQARALGAPMLAVERALREAESGPYMKIDVVSVFDISQPSSRKRFYLLDFVAGTTTAYHSSHGKGNGGHDRATRFRGFNKKDSFMVPLGALRTGESVYPLEGYIRITDKYTRKVYDGLTILDIEGVKPYNNRFHRFDLWAVFHSQWYVTEGYRRANGGHLGRSLGCLVLDPLYSNDVFKRVEGGSLVYVTVGNDPIEKYID